MAQVLLQGTNFVNFIGPVRLRRRRRPRLRRRWWCRARRTAGSHRQRRFTSSRIPKNYAKFTKKRELNEAYHHHGDIESLQLRGEYLYTAKGKHGIEVYDVANIDNKALAERMVTAPVSPLGQRFSVKTQDARWIAVADDAGVDPARLPQSGERGAADPSALWLSICRRP